MLHFLKKHYGLQSKKTNRNACKYYIFIVVKTPYCFDFFAQ